MKNLRKVLFQEELEKGVGLYEEGKFAESLDKFGRAHIISQRYVIEHTISHLWMLKVGIKTKDIKEIIGQLLRIPAGVIGSFIQVLPIGNTGRSNVGAFKKMEVPMDLKELLKDH